MIVAANNNIVRLALNNINELLYGIKCDGNDRAILEFYIYNVGCKDIKPCIEDGDRLLGIGIDCGKVENISLTSIYTNCPKSYNLRIYNTPKICATPKTLTVSNI